MENNLISKVINGDRQAAKLVYEEYFGYVITICRRYHVSDQDTKDYIQEIFSSAFESLHKYDPKKGELKTWLRRVSINTIISIRRKQNVRIATKELENTDLTANTQAADESLQYKDLLDIVKRMPINYLIPFNMFVIDGFSSKEISERLDINENTVRTLVRRGREWMKKRVVHLAKV